MTYGTVTFMVEGDELSVQDAQERIQKAIGEHCPDLICSVTEDIWDDDKTPVFDALCYCPNQTQEHRLSSHGTSPEWDAEHYWTLNPAEVYQ